MLVGTSLPEGKGKEVWAYNQTQKVAENRNSLRNDPRNDPETQSDSDPGADSYPVAFMHAVSSAEDTHVDVFECDVAVYDSCDNNLFVFELVTVLIRQARGRESIQ